ncbi:hypothetical protein RB614_20685 [Phytohabitans sp. ZYX-F-186]|uniref:Uncharacterized protein n=1 Tax=Phytohabitans maris TaxID=3071409 RepID=A0ABU0ZIQ0_9ACTN|nr:hypothetical protein [Phytohabitans sp. ZYX-F-186]MDQ7906933.1 hypothetical protein [Phytohabitans sp. ZYX-F-186]
MRTYDEAWNEYVTAAQRLDAVRRGVAAAAGEQAQAARSAHEELAGVRARLAPQRAKLLAQGVPDAALTPSPAEVAGAAAAMAGGPPAVLAALRHARATADAADETELGRRPVGPRGETPAWLRNMIVYGPFAVVVLIVQVALYLAADNDLVLYAVLCGLTMPAAAFGLGWLTIGLAFVPPPGEKIDRTPLFGIAVCFAPVVATCMGVGLLNLVR